jgi:hypothetical protein
MLNCGPTQDTFLLWIVGECYYGPTKDTILLEIVGGWNCGPAEDTIPLGLSVREENYTNWEGNLVIFVD